MKKWISFLLAACLVLGISGASAATKPRIMDQPVFADSGSGTAIVIKITVKNAEGLTWRFVNPQTGEETTATKLPETFPGISVTGPNRQTLTLENVPPELNGWKVYCHLSGNGYHVDSDPLVIQIGDASLPDSSDPAAATSSDVAATASDVPDAQPAENPDSAADPAQAPAEPEAASPAELTPAAEPEPVSAGILIRGENVLLYPVQGEDDFPVETDGSTELSFDNGPVSFTAVADGEVDYWVVNGIRLITEDSFVKLTLENVTADVQIRAVLARRSTPVSDAAGMVQVTCEGCSFTYLDGGLRSVTSGTVPAGAQITVNAASAAAASGGYSINGGEYEKEGKLSIRITVSEDTVIRTR